jgi:hypothetical protein
MRKVFQSVVLAMLLAVASAPAAAQAMANQTLGLYPKSAGEVAYVDLRVLRNSPHYTQLKSQVLPERFRNLAQWAEYMGIEFEKEIHQLSWAFLPPGADGQAGLVGVAEGNLPPREVEAIVKKRKLDFSHHRGFLVVSLGKNDAGREFVFAFVDSSTAVFGFRDIAEEILNRRAGGGENLLSNTAVMRLVQQVNGRAPVWMAMNKQFTLLGLKQMLPGVTDLPGYETLATRVESAIVQFDITTEMRGRADVRCQSSSDAVVLTSLMQAALAYQTWRLNESNPDLAKALGTMNLKREDTSVQLALALRQDEFVNLLSKNSFALNF